MKTAKKYLIIYDGNLTGNEYHGDIISISDTKEDAQTVLKGIIKEDDELYGRMIPILSTDTKHTALSESDQSVWCCYEIKEIKVYVR